MIDYEKILIDLEMIVKSNGFVVINDQQVEITNPEIRLQFMMYKIKQATDRAYFQRLGANSQSKYPFSKFEREASRFSYIITNMAYTSMIRIGTEGQTSDSENGKNRAYESGGLYLLSDIQQITPLAGVL